MKKQQYNDTIFADYCRFFDNGSILWRKNDCYTIIIATFILKIVLHKLRAAQYKPLKKNAT